MTDPLLAEADELYALALPDFTPVRDARAKALRAEDRELSLRVKALRKPSLAAWVVNLLVRREAAQVEQVLGVGAALREAQASLDGAELRELTRQRRQLTSAVTGRARALAAEEGVRVTDSVADQVSDTLTAAMIDAQAAAAVRSGLLVAALAATGVDRVDVAAAVATPDALGFAATAREAVAPPPPELHVVPNPEPDEEERRLALESARSDLDQAERDLAAAWSDLEAARRAVDDASAARLQGQAELDELRRRQAEVEVRLDDVDAQLDEAQQTRDVAAARSDEAQGRRDRAAALVAELHG